ncbi:MAG TPA: Gfo/Idh/MocA family oxidoreductase [Chitinophagaceae bacterium]|nr:Gfo/Idh/MocA family oxidoreductase [Chitinophagaceae bacterium]
MAQVIRWGILGAGRIAAKFASDLLLVQDALLVAVGSGNKERAAAFAEKFNAERSYGSYEELVADAEVDIIYVATTHNFHYENTLLCLNAGKAVLCEKPFAMNSRQVKEMINVARAKRVFLMEALWTKFLPQYNKVLEMLKEGIVGDIRSIRADFGFRPKEPVSPRLFDPALGGGTVMDIGIYPVFITLSLLGRPGAIEATMSPASTGVDLQCAMLFKYDDGALAQLFSTNDTDTATDADIYGTKGRIRLSGRFHELSAVVDYTPWGDNKTQRIHVEKDAAGWGYQYEARHAGECLRKGLTESPVMSHQDSIDLIETLDTIRQIAGIHYPADDE